MRRRPLPRGGGYFSLSGMLTKTSDLSGSERTDGVKSKYDLEMDVGFGAAVAIGAEFPSGWRAEAEFAYRQAGIDEFKDLKIGGVKLGDFDDYKGKLKTMSLMGNGYFDFEAMGVARAYLGAGVGLARHRLSIPAQTIVNDTWMVPVNKVSGSDTVFAYQVMAGVRYPLSPVTDLRAGYRYFGTGDMKGDGVELSYGSHGLEVGIVHRF